jgi:hypothetical protein
LALGRPILKIAIGKYLLTVNNYHKTSTTKNLPKGILLYYRYDNSLLRPLFLITSLFLIGVIIGIIPPVSDLIILEMFISLFGLLEAPAILDPSGRGIELLIPEFLSFFHPELVRPIGQLLFIQNQIVILAPTFGVWDVILIIFLETNLAKMYPLAAFVHLPIFSSV